MPGDPKECRKHAARCAELAARAKAEHLKAMLLQLSKSWEKLAIGLENVLNTPDQAEIVSLKQYKTRRISHPDLDGRMGQPANEN
jgi:hypothetical protein